VLNVSGARERLRRVDPLLGACCLVALVVYLMHGFDGLLATDEGIYAYAGQQVAQGVAPYVGIANRVGPLAHLLPGGAAVVARGIGVDDLLAMRVFFMLIAVACVGLAYLVGRDVFRSRFAGVASAAALLSIHGFIELATYGPREKTPMVLFMLASLLAIAHQRWLTTGVLVSLATLTWQPSFFPLIAAALVAVLLGAPRRDWWRALARVTVGGLVPTAVTIGSYAAIDRLQMFLDCFVLINAKYTYGLRKSVLYDPAAEWVEMDRHYGASLWVIFAGLAALLVSAAVAAARRGDREPRIAALVGYGVGALVAIGWTSQALDGWPDVFLVFPFAAVGVGSLVQIVVNRAPGKVALASTLAVAAACTAMAVGFSVGGHDDRLVEQRRATETLLKVLPHARVYSVAAPQSLVLTHQRQGSRFQLFAHGMFQYLNDTYPGGIRGYRLWVAQRAPTVIALRDVQPWWLAPTIRVSYVKVGRAPGWNWYVRRDVGPEVLRDLDEALAAGARQDDAHDRTTR
jgi:Dolichyl-phosphate-mannose-protein mannosyltransferase